MIRLPPALRGDGLPIEAELVTPVLAVERPDDVLLVRLDDVGLRLGRRDLAAGDRLIELISLRGGDVDEDLGAVAEVLVQLVEVSLVAILGELPGVAHGDVARELESVLHVVAERRLLERGGGLLEAIPLFVEDADVFDVAEELAI